MAKTSGEVRSSSSSSSRGKTIKQREGFKTYNTKDGIIEVPELHIDIHGKPVGTIEWKLWEKTTKKDCTERYIILIQSLLILDTTT